MKATDSTSDGAGPYPREQMPELRRRVNDALAAAGTNSASDRVRDEQERYVADPDGVGAVILLEQPADGRRLRRRDDCRGYESCPRPGWCIAALRWAGSPPPRRQIKSGLVQRPLDDYGHFLQLSRGLQADPAHSDAVVAIVFDEATPPLPLSVGRRNPGLAFA